MRNVAMRLSNVLSRLPFWPRRGPEPLSLLEDDSPEELDGWIKIYTGDALLARPEMAYYVEEVKRRYENSTEDYYSLVEIPLYRLASLLQLLPASEYYHHYEPGGLLRHHLECMAMAVSTDYQVHQLVGSEQQFGGHVPQGMRFWTHYCLAIRAATHDVGKLLTMFEIWLRIEDANGEFFEERYDPMDGGFGAFSLLARALRELRNGARSVRYRYLFRRSSGMHDHERYWQDGIRCLLSNLSHPIPGRYFDRHLTDCPAFFEYLKPKLDDIDRRSVVKYLSRQDMPTSAWNDLCRRLISDLADHPSLRGAHLVRGQDARQRLFLTFSVLQSFLSDMPDTYYNQLVPRLPDQCMHILKGAGFTERFVDLPDNRRFFQEYNGSAGVFLTPSVTVDMLGLKFLNRCRDNVSAFLGDLYATVRQAPPPSGEGLFNEASSESDDSLSSSAAEGSDRSGPQSLGVAAKDSSAPDRDNSLSAARLALLGAESIATSLGDSDQSGTSEPSDRPKSSRTSPPVRKKKPSKRRRSADSGPALGPEFNSPPGPESDSSHQDPDLATPMDAVTHHLNTLSPEAVADPTLVSVRDGCWVFSRAFATKLLRSLGKSRRFSDTQFSLFTSDAGSRLTGDWVYQDGEIVCTPEFSQELTARLGEPGQGDKRHSVRPAHPQAVLFDSLIDGTDDQCAAPSSKHSSPKPATASTSKASAQTSDGRDYPLELRGLMDTVRMAHRSAGNRWMEFDGQSVRIDFLALDAFTGDRQKRGRVLEMLRGLGLYLRHTRAVAVFIHPDHPEVRACLDDLQQSK